MLCLNHFPCPSDVLDPWAWVLLPADPLSGAIRFSFDQKENKIVRQPGWRRIGGRCRGTFEFQENGGGGRKVTYADLLSRLSFEDGVLRHTFDDVQADPLVILGQLDIVFVCDPARDVESGFFPHL